MNAKKLSWVDPRLEVRQSSKHGVGTFAKAIIRKGEKVIVQGGRMVGDDELEDESFKPLWYHCFQVERDVYVCPIGLNHEDLDGVFKVNHSCDPTCGFRGQVTMVAMRDIAPGEEITFDYAMSDVEPGESDWEAMACNCGSPICRKGITGSDWRLPELRERYRGYFSRYVEELINSRDE